MRKQLGKILKKLEISDSEGEGEDEVKEIDADEVAPAKTDVKPVEESEDKPQPLPEDPKKGDEVPKKDDDEEHDPAPSNPA